MRGSVACEASPTDTTSASVKYRADWRCSGQPPHNRTARSQCALGYPWKRAFFISATGQFLMSQPTSFPRLPQAPTWTSQQPTRSGRSRLPPRFRSLCAFASPLCRVELGHIGLTLFLRTALRARMRCGAKEHRVPNDQSVLGQKQPLVSNLLVLLLGYAASRSLRIPPRALGTLRIGVACAPSISSMWAS